VAELDPALVQFEIDCYWAHYAGVDPAGLIQSLAGRFPLIHLKDMIGEGESRTFAEVGEGIIDWQPVFAASEAQGAQWYVVEQDRCARPSLESAALSLANLRRWGKA
ncbi:MAG: sugar phosphate isomerase/epimerase, partial [Chloroflexi bacterium]|nr:sugar phosphate isomerase/epimerase [Chloroflexota bacterium]